MNCDILDLRVFLAVVELGSFNQAAIALNLSQPALSRRIQKLEEVVGASLIERTTRSVAPTLIGTELLPMVRRMLEEFDSSLFAVKELGTRQTGIVTIACVATAASYFLPPVIRRFNQEYPNIRFRIASQPAERIMQAVARGDVEFGISFVGNSVPEFVFHPLIEDPFVVALPADHALTRFKTLTWHDLEPYRLVTVHRLSSNRALLDASIGIANLSLNWFYEVSHTSAALGFVESGLGISIVPRMCLPQGALSAIVHRPLIKPVVSRTIGIVRRRAGTLSPPAEQFFSMLRRAWS